MSKFTNLKSDIDIQVAALLGLKVDINYFI